MSRRGLSRRRFLLVAAGGATGAVLVAFVGDPPQAVDGPEVGDRLRALLTDFAGAAALGALVATDALGAPAADVVASGGGTRRGWFAAVDDAAFADHVATNVNADIAAGRIVSVDGWALARTEAAICVLAASLATD